MPVWLSGSSVTLLIGLHCCFVRDQLDSTQDRTFGSSTWPFGYLAETSTKAQPRDVIRYPSRTGTTPLEADAANEELVDDLVTCCDACSRPWESPSSSMMEIRLDKKTTAAFDSLPCSTMTDKQRERGRLPVTGWNCDGAHRYRLEALLLVVEQNAVGKQDDIHDQISARPEDRRTLEAKTCNLV
ncbi:uncharacterized protein L969DRAFT_75548 [Mixia osmundae IAM 14324]|uniref:Secreted protein n=1 Tax=Mixia osmundae (strain CBS 9802 / IAM 14324 / JCM 22182 / KY 12970) TaxID=764103 RepID=G7E147_MIXOS|nr:uncharacterized protein L969DRAFT_75548 [Mixia osmundae IAM 14324]KEI38803.1 hypothetical protein L969DRAFT_75548 [Mixia osmundae IAM 14324]GAA96557.1 hypothetical protein E5Q_03226 [Mixia osmundae IAM 14324]